jgi:L-ribulokinase
MLAAAISRKKIKKALCDGCQDKLLKLLDMKLSKLPAAQNVVSVDWFNGRRYPDINEDVKGGIYGLTLGTDYMQVYQSLVLATIYGAKRVFDSFVENGMVIDENHSGRGNIPEVSIYYADIFRRA